MNNETLLDRVEEGLTYFEFRLQDLKLDDKHYIEAFIQYIDLLEREVDKLSKQLK